MALRVDPLMAVISAAAAAEESSSPRIIYGETMPQVIYGPPSAHRPNRAPPPAAPEPRPQAEARTTLDYGWVPAGPPVRTGPPPPHRRPPPRPLPPRPSGDAWPPGFFRGVAPDARTPLDRREPAIDPPP